MIKRILTASALILSSTIAMAQDISANGQYYINRYSVAPAYAGFNGNAEAFLGYRSTMGGIEGAPRIMRVDANAQYMGNMGLGMQVINEKSGNFDNTVALLTYAYHLQLDNDMSLSFGISPTLIRSAYNLSKATTESASSDPVLANQAGMSATGFDAGFSILFNMQNLYLSINAPRLICGDLKFKNGIANANRKIMADVSYVIEQDKIEIEPVVSADYTFDEGVAIKGAAVARYNKRAWLQLSYSTDKWIGVGAGFNANGRIAINYQYETGTSLLAKQTSGTHEITLGFLINKAKKTKQPTVFIGEEPKTENPKKDTKDIQKLYKEIDRLDNKIDNYHSGAHADNNAAPTPEETPNKWMDNEAKEEKEVAEKWDAPINLPNVKFGYGSAEMFSSSQTILNKFVAEMDKNKGKKMMVIVYVDCMGSKAFAKALAQKRAEAVKKYMQSKGIAGSRIETRGAISRNPKMELEPSQRYQENRVELRYQK